MKKVTILGSEGFIGKYLTEEIKKKAIHTFIPEKNQNLSGIELGHIIYCIGVTADFRIRPSDTISAHVCYLIELLKNSSFESIFYLSSTRVYKGLEQTNESNSLIVNPNDSDDLYNISKLMGENILLSAYQKQSCILRLSNVYGLDITNGNFINSIISDAIKNNKIILNSSLESEKDYISVNKVVETIINMVLNDCRGVYNLASGINTTNRSIINKIKEITACDVLVNENSPKITFPIIDIKKIKDDMNFVPSDIINDLNSLITLYKNSM